VTLQANPQWKFWAKLLAGAAVVALVVVSVPFLGQLTAGTPGEQDLGSGSPTDPNNWDVNVPAGPLLHYATELPALGTGPAIDAAALAAADPRRFFWTMLARQGTRPVSDMIVSHWNDPEEYTREFPADHQTHHIGIDWRTRAWVEETFTVGDNGQTEDTHELARCLGNAQVATWHPRTEHSREPARWDLVPSGQNGDQLCIERMLPGEKAGNRRSTDGVAPAGLTPAEMDAFISYLDGVPGLVEVFPPVPVRDAAGRQFIQLDVALNPTDPQERGTDKRVGVGFLNAAFGQTGKDPEEYAYSIDVEEEQGRRMRYFVDPQTMLPTYAAMMITTPQRLNGAPAPDPHLHNSYFVYRYLWPDALDPAATVAKGTPVYPNRPWPLERVVF
jgi:hypothetical protein